MHAHVKNKFKKIKKYILIYLWRKTYNTLQNIRWLVDGFMSLVPEIGGFRWKGHGTALLALKYGQTFEWRTIGPSAWLVIISKKQG
jgi:hypothetical protein